ncbi:MAG: MliC family protein [Burkholderiaceae bacterium]|jgi:membrane-bound inhibitor of C-type lysozyme|nr:MliC family protein [Burkholderiaceae bacterium]
MSQQLERSFPLRLGAVCAALGALALAGCATPVNLNQPVPVQQLNPPTPRVTVPPSTYAPATPQAPTSQAQPLAPSAPITVQPLGPAGVAPAASAPAASQFAPAVPAPEVSAPQSSAPALPPGAVRFNCQDGSSFIATFGDVSVTLQTALGNLTLDQTVSADGARYRNSAFQVWFKGRQATVTNFLQNTNTVCQQQ